MLVVKNINISDLVGISTIDILYILYMNIFDVYYWHIRDSFILLQLRTLGTSFTDQQLKVQYNVI